CRRGSGGPSCAACRPVAACWPWVSALIASICANIACKFALVPFAKMQTMFCHVSCIWGGTLLAGGRPFRRFVTDMFEWPGRSAILFEHHFVAILGAEPRRRQLRCRRQA